MALDTQSSKVCTFNTPVGRYCFLRLPSGIWSAPEVVTDPQTLCSAPAWKCVSPSRVSVFQNSKSHGLNASKTEPLGSSNPDSYCELCPVNPTEIHSCLETFTLPGIRTSASICSDSMQPFQNRVESEYRTEMSLLARTRVQIWPPPVKLSQNQACFSLCPFVLLPELLCL